MAQTSSQQGVRKEESRDGRQSVVETVFAYHEQTKHHFHRYARSLGYMDWATQPHPFRHYEGSRQTPLDLSRSPRPLTYDQLYEDNPLTPQEVDLDSLADLFRYSLGLSAWKQAGSSRWALRINPSSGNLHPTEAYAVLPPLSGASATPALYHYLSESHVLEQRASFSDDVWRSFAMSLPEGSFLVGLSSVIWHGESSIVFCIESPVPLTQIQAVLESRTPNITACAHNAVGISLEGTCFTEDVSFKMPWPGYGELTVKMDADEGEPIHRFYARVLLRDPGIVYSDEATNLAQILTISWTRP